MIDVDIPTHQHNIEITPKDEVLIKLFMKAKCGSWFGLT